MVDTMMIYHTFKKYEEYNKVCGIIREQSKNFNHKTPLYYNGKRLITYAFARSGIERIEISEDKQYSKYTLYMKVRPRLMVEENDYDNVLRVYDVPQLYQNFEKLMNDIGLKDLSDMKKWKVKRIDYAVDIVVPQEDIAQYIKLFHNGNIRDTLLSSEVSDKYKDSVSNLYLAFKNCYVNFYDRYTTALLKKEKNPNKYSNIEGRYGILRFEVQLRKPNIPKLKKYGHIQSNIVDAFLNISLCKHYILKYYNEIVGRGNYYPYHKAFEKCKSGQQRDIIHLVHQTGSVYSAKQTFINRGGDKRKLGKKFSEIINKLEKMGINPVTTDNEYIENLYDKLIYSIDGSNKLMLKRRNNRYGK